MNEEGKFRSQVVHELLMQEFITVGSSKHYTFVFFKVMCDSVVRCSCNVYM
jgi:hypothetical protein